MLIELRQPLPLLTPKGKARAFFLIDYGTESNLLFVTFLDGSGECWCWQAKDVRLEANITYGTSALAVPPRSDPFIKHELW